MENFENRPNSDGFEQQKASEFHFNEIAEIEPAMLSLVDQLKDNIETGEYDTLISDDVGGRIPTLVLRKIIRLINPNQQIDTYFVAGGKTYLPGPEKGDQGEQLQEYLTKIGSKAKKALLVTQYIHTGSTIIKLTEALKETGLSSFDVAAVDVMPHFEKEKSLRDKLAINNLYIGSDEWHHLHEEHERVGGVRKPRKEYSPFPQRTIDVTAKEGRVLSDEEWKEIFEIEKGDSYQTIDEKTKDPGKIVEFERRTQIPLTVEEKQETQRDINLAREDVELLANRVKKQVWGG